MSELTFIGLDVHARSVAAALLDARTGEVRNCAAPAHTAELVGWLCAQGESLSVAYEAGPTGFGLARACAAAQIPCLVAAPSRIPRAPGERIKTDRRDALKLAKLLRVGELVAVRVPSPCEEAARDLVRAREDARGDLMRARHRLSKLLLRQGLLWEGTAWTLAHERWLASQSFAARGLEIA
jgi:transposase